MQRVRRDAAAAFVSSCHAVLFYLVCWAGYDLCVFSLGIVSSVTGPDGVVLIIWDPLLRGVEEEPVERRHLALLVVAVCLSFRECPSVRWPSFTCRGKAPRQLLPPSSPLGGVRGSTAGFASLPFGGSFFSFRT